LTSDNSCQTDGELLAPGTLAQLAMNRQTLPSGAALRAMLNDVLPHDLWIVAFILMFS
jgi:hypothetical protein